MPNTVKTFKIGLSATDKQNMAQDIYELVVNMCFDEYDSANTYNQGDFVVYENPTNTFKLYKCIANNVTGAWDNTKWELAKLQDILDDIENAVQYVNDKANVDGNYPTMTVGVADQLSPYDEDSGDDQDEPFSFQATGTANGTQSDFSTGSIALMKEKQGNTVCVNQMVVDPHFTDLSKWDFNANYGTGSISNGVFTMVPNTSSNERVAYLSDARSSANDFIIGHKYLFILDIKNNSSIELVFDILGGSGYSPSDINDTNWHTVFKLKTCSALDYSYTIYIVNKGNEFSEGDSIQYKNAYAIDLTQMFNGNIPADLLSHPENFFRYYQGSLAYNTGTLVNANGNKLVSTGRQLWDEETRKGYYDTNGVFNANNSYLANKNPIRVIPNTTYYFLGSSKIGRICFYDENMNFISTTTGSGTKTIPINCAYINFDLLSTYGTTYNNDITISLYYSGESGYDQYYPYEVLTNNDTGTETLRRIPVVGGDDIFDSKAPDGTITRRVAYLKYSGGSNIEIDGTNYSVSNKSVDSISGGYYVFSFLISSISSSYCRAAVGDTALNNYGVAINNPWGGEGRLYVFNNNGSLCIAITLADTSLTSVSAYDTQFASKSLEINAPLTTPTTEQGTTFSENLVIDDFGTMDFSGTNGVPQGNLIFYPVDYKAFIDTLYNYTEGTPSNIALKSDLTDFLTETKNNSGITAETGITIDIAKLTKISNIVFIDFVIHNSSGSPISANTKILEIASGYRPVNTSYGLFSDHGFEVKANGDITTLEGMSAGQYVEYHGSYQI